MVVLLEDPEGPEDLKDLVLLWGQLLQARPWVREVRCHLADPGVHPNPSCLRYPKAPKSTWRKLKSGILHVIIRLGQELY